MLFLRYAKSIDLINVICGDPMPDIYEIFKRLNVKCKLVKYALG